MVHFIANNNPFQKFGYKHFVRDTISEQDFGILWKHVKSELKGIEKNIKTYRHFISLSKIKQREVAFSQDIKELKKFMTSLKDIATRFIIFADIDCNSATVQKFWHEPLVMFLEANFFSAPYHFVSPEEAVDFVYDRLFKLLLDSVEE